MGGLTASFYFKFLVGYGLIKEKQHCLLGTWEKRKKIELIDDYGKLAKLLKYYLSSVQPDDIYIILQFYRGEEGHSDLGRTIECVGNEIKTRQSPS